MMVLLYLVDVIMESLWFHFSLVINTTLSNY